MYAGWIIYDDTKKIIVVKLLANENFPAASVLLLRNMGYDIASIGMEYPGISDEYVMTLAEDQQRIILTFDKDYGELIYKHNYKPTHGVIFLRLAEYEPDEPANIIHRLFMEYKIETEHTLTVFDGLMIRQRRY
jgi:predicted nuclease of predicted toxin-antitoxin system